MQLRWIKPEATTGAQRGDAVICIVGATGQLVDTVRSIAAHTAAEVPILLCGSAGTSGPSPEVERELRDSGHPIGFAVGIEEAIKAAAPADVVVLWGCIVGAGWLAGLKDAANVDTRVASATAMTDRRSPFSAGRIPVQLSFDEAAAAVHARALRNRPRLPAAGRHCVYIRRSALELVGDFGAQAQPDFSQRCLYSGLSHVLADDVLVASGGDNGVAEEAGFNQTEPVARSIGVARRALTGLSVVLDGRILGGPMNGTRVHVLELIGAIVRSGRADVTVLVGSNLDAEDSRLVKSTGAALMTAAEASVLPPAFHADLVHRPFQLSDPAELALLTRLADRLVITHQDLIGYHNPSYFRSPQEWEDYRGLIRTALGAADRVVFPSAHARDDALAEDLVEPDRTDVVHHGVDHTVTASPRGIAVAPAGIERMPPDAQLVLCLGTDFRHKNRIFALRLLDELRRRHDWRGWLVLAGPPVAFGSSVFDEDALLARRPGLADAVLRLGAVSEAEKSWLLGRANLVAYPSVQEGFGLVPFEAAEHGVPCLWAPGAAMSEVIPDAAAAIVPWDVAASADRALELLRDEHAAGRNVHAVRSAAAALTWERAAARLLDLYQSACDQPHTPASVFGRTEGLTSSGLSEDAIRLVGPAGALPRDLERPLLALATHPRIAAPVFRAIRAGYRVSYRWRHSGPSGNGTER